MISLEISAVAVLSAEFIVSLSIFQETTIHFHHQPYFRCHSEYLRILDPPSSCHFFVGFCGLSAHVALLAVFCLRGDGNCFHELQHGLLMHPPSHSPVPGLPVVCPDKEIANCWYLAEDSLVSQELNAGFKLVLESLKTVQPRFRKFWAEELVERVCVSPQCVDFDSVLTSLTIAIESPSLLDDRLPPADRTISKLFVCLKHLVGIVRDVRHIIEFDLRSYSDINQSAHLHSILFIDTNSTVGHTRMVYKAHVSVEIPDHTSFWPGSFERVRFHPAPLMIFTEIIEVRSQPHEEPLISKFEVV